MIFFKDQKKNTEIWNSLKILFIIITLLLVFLQVNTISGNFVRNNQIKEKQMNSELLDDDFLAIYQKSDLYSGSASLSNENSNFSIDFSYLLGGDGTDYGRAVKVDNNDNIIIASDTNSSNCFTVNAFDSSYNYQSDVFITKFDSNGILLWSSYFGGSGEDFIYGMVIDSFDNFYITGRTNSSDFPTLNAYDSTYNGESDCFVSKFSSNGLLLWSTFLGGMNVDCCTTVNLDDFDDIIVTGYTESPDFPILNAFDSSYNGYQDDAFITKFTNEGSLFYSTFLGGYWTDYGFDVLIDSSNNVIITGATYAYDFPTLNAYDSTHNGGYDVFITKFSRSGELLWSTYMGGYANDVVNDAIIDSSDNIIITGRTCSSNFPTKKAYDLTFNGGYCDAFVIKFSVGGSLLWSTFLGGYEADIGYGISVDASDNIIIAGISNSVDFPLLFENQSIIGGNFDCIFAKFSSTGYLLFSSYLGENEDDRLFELTTDQYGNLFAIGHTFSLSDFISTNRSLLSPVYDSSAIILLKFKITIDESFTGILEDRDSNYIDNNNEFLAIDFNILFDAKFDDFGCAIEVDSSNNIIITGNTESSNFPVLNAYDDTLNGDFDIFVAKLSDNGSLIWCTYFGGNSDDLVFDVALDSFDNIIISGHTFSKDFPTKSAYDESFNGIHDVFITKFSNSGSLLWSTYFGGEDIDFCSKIAIENNDNIVLIGNTESIDFPTKYAYDNTKNGYQDDDVFIAKFSNEGVLIWSTYFGGMWTDYGRAVVIDSENNIIITGATYSYDFPTLNAYDQYYHGHYDVFLSKFSNSGSLIWSTYIGGVETDAARDIVTDSADNIIITGKALSFNYPAFNAYDTSFNGISDAFVTKFSTNGNLLWSTFLGGTDTEYSESVAVDSADNLLIVGFTYSNDFPMLNTFQDTNNGDRDCFITIMNSGGYLRSSSYFGSLEKDNCNDIKMDNDGDIVVTGFLGAINEQTISQNCFLMKFTFENQTINYSTIPYDIISLSGDSSNSITYFGFDISLVIITVFTGGIFRQKIRRNK